MSHIWHTSLLAAVSWWRPATEDETPEKEKEKPKKARNEELAQQGYAILLEKVLEELDFFTEPFQGLRWLENKKQLLVYHYAARMNEQKDAILQAISSNEEVKDLDPIYQRAANAVRDELVGLFEGQKMKKMFSHDHVIRFHSLKGVPVHRECCVFLRERPQCSSDILRKTPSIFRDLIRYRGQTSPLMELEHHHLALVLTVGAHPWGQIAPTAWISLEGTTQVGEMSEDAEHLTLERHLLPFVEWPRDTQSATLRPLETATGGDPENALETLSTKITDEVLLKLHRDGFVIVDDALPLPVCETLRHEMDILLEHGQMWNSQSYSHEEGALHHDIWETTLDFKDVRLHAPTFNRMENDEGLLRVLRRLPVLQDLSMQHLRLQVNKGNGGCYTMHTDSGISGEEDGKQVLRVTALFYLNDEWRSEHGGELRVYPYPSVPVKIPPTLGRLVLFHPRLVHEVLPNFRRRYCFTLWCAVNLTQSTTSSNFMEDLESMTDFNQACMACEKMNSYRAKTSRKDMLQGIPRPLRCLFLPELRPLLVRYVFRDCELQSASRSHDEGPQKQEMMEGIARYHQQMRDENPTLDHIVTDRNPRAWLVISPLLAKPGLLEKVSSCTWPEIKEKLQDELTSLIRHESDVWRGFIQRHADMVSKESLKIIQKVLKGCQPGASVGEFSIQTARFAEDVDEANEARELAEMRFAEAEQRWDMSAQLEVATVEEKRLDAERKVKKLSSMERRLKIRVHLQALRLKAKKEDDLEEERQAAEAQMESLRKKHRDDLSRVQRDADELKRALDREQVRCIQLKEEATLLEESKQELLQAIAKLDAEERKDRRQWRTKNAVLKQHLKQGKQQQKELVAKMTAEAEAKVAEVQTAMTQEVSQLRAALLEAQQAQRSSFAQLEVQSATLQRTGQLNTELRSSAAKAEDDARMAREAAAAALSSREEARCQVETLQKEVQLAKETTQKELAEAEAKHKKALWEMKRLQGDYDDVLEEVALASKTCDSLRVDAAKATLVEKEKAVLEEQLRKATMAQAEAVKRIQSLELLEKELQETLKQREAELNNKMETLAKLQERNRSLQVAAAEAAEKEQEAKGQLLAAQEKLGLETSTALAAQGALAEAQQAKDQAMEENLKVQELQRMAEAKCKEAIAQQLDAQHQCTQAQQAFAAVEQRELRAKAELISQSQEAHRLTEKCVSLSHEKAELEQKLQQKLVTHEQVEQSLMAKQAELQVTQDALKTLQESNRTLRDERATACAASEEALRLATEAQRLVEVAKTQRQKAEAKAAESIKNATEAEEKLQEVEQRFSKIETERDQSEG
eukprot:symbB.v1.2.028660.t2/scaffold3059.1/size64457/3